MMTMDGESWYGKLKNTGLFGPGALKHIFEGELNKGAAGGYHYEGIPNTPGRIIPGTETFPDRNSVYNGKVTVYGVRKPTNGGESSFFPKFMSPQDVVDSINEAYGRKRPIWGNAYEGETLLGMRISMCLDGSGKVISAYPVYEGPEDAIFRKRLGGKIR
jgi:hypothetical protein